uniref:DUF4283 domain-containing protein n=1 Tax=Oryza nivara TaxID=4536 RepID=A0A0E0IHS4_ORYNI
MALSAGDAAAALSAALHLPAGRFSVHCAQPDHFLIVFANSGDRDLALSRSPIPAPPYQLILRPWTRLVTATSFSMPFRVSLDLEGVPAHAWNASTAAALVAPGRFISVDTPVRPDEYRFLRVTISSHNPAAIPKARLLLIPELTLGSQCLLRYRVLLHVRSVVCLSAPSASGDVDPAGGGGASGEGGGAANDGGGDLGARSSRGLDGGSRRDGSRRDGAPQRRSSGVLGGVRLAEVAGAEARSPALAACPAGSANVAVRFPVLPACPTVGPTIQTASPDLVPPLASAAVAISPFEAVSPFDHSLFASSFVSSRDARALDPMLIPPSLSTSLTGSLDAVMAGAESAAGVESAAPPPHVAAVALSPRAASPAGLLSPGPVSSSPAGSLGGPSPPLRLVDSAGPTCDLEESPPLVPLGSPPALAHAAHAATSFSPLADDGRGLLLALPDATGSPATADAVTASPVDVVPPVDAGSLAADVATTCSPVAAGMPATAVAAAGSTAPAVVAPDSPVAAVAVFSSPTAVAASSSPAASPVDIVAASSSPAATVAAFGSPAVVVASNSLVAGSLAAVVSLVCATSPVAACHPPTASSLLSGPSGGGPAFPASPLCSRRSPLLADGIAASYAEPTGLFFDELDALAAEFGPAVPSPPRVSPVPPSASGAGTSLPRTACTPPTGGEWLRPESPLPQQAPTLVVDVPDGVLYDVPMVVLDLDGRPLAHSLPSSVADNAALRAFLTSCSRPLPPALLSPPLPLPPLAAKAVEVVPKRSERIAAKMALEALEGPIHAVSRAQRNLMRKLGLVPERGPVTTEAVAAYNALFSKPLS